jgi:hypothetical protein
LKIEGRRKAQGVRLKIEGIRQKTEDRRQKTEDRRQRKCWRLNVSGKKSNEAHEYCL